jgi:parallel beta-helix repeat protein
MTRLLLVAAALAILVLAGVAAAAMPPVSYFSQCDSRWGSDKLGGDGPTICSQGCALTSTAMVMAYYGVDTDPQRLNDAIGRAGYDAGYNIYWSAVRNVCHDEVNQIEYDPGTVKPFDTTVLNTHLDAGHPVIVNVGGHFVVVTGRSDGTYYINDPISSAKSTLDDYPSRVGMRIYSGNPPDINKPLVGDWNGNGTDTTGIYNYTTANFSLDSGLNISFGISGDIPITGDWNGNGYDAIGVFRPSTAQFFLDYDNDGVSDMNAMFGVIGDTPVVGDWDGDGGDNIGLYRSGSTTGVFYPDIDNDGGSADIVTPEYGDLGGIPIAGDWGEDSDDNIGVCRPGTGEFFLDATVPDVLPSKMIYVDDDFSDDPSGHRWDTIQEGVNDASDGDTVIVYAGAYCENVKVNKSITLRSAGADVVTVETEDTSDHVFEVTADWVSVSGFTAIGATEGGWAGIYLDNVDYCDISDNKVSNNGYGIHLWCSGSNAITNNTANSNNNIGIALPSSSNNVLIDNVVTNNDVGISVSISGNSNTLTNNNASNNLCGIQLSVSSNNVLTNNTANSNNYRSICLSHSSDNILANNNASNSDYGIWLGDSSNNVLTDNIANLNNNTGIILLSSSSDNILTNNTASNNGGGVHLQYSSNNVLIDNTADSNNGSGIYLYYSSNNTLTDNTMTGNTHNFGVFSISLLRYIQNIDTSNIVDGKPIYYWVDQQDQTVPNDAGFVGIINCTNITVRNLTLTNNEQAVLLAYSDNSKIENITTSNNYRGIHLSFSSSSNVMNIAASNNYYGIYLYQSSNNTLENLIASNNDYGIRLWSSSNNNVKKNNANLNNYCGISLQYSNDNKIYLNNFIDNTQNAYDTGTNQWDSGSEGNYYSDYTGTDNNTDGIGEDPYSILGGGGSVDHFPLMQPWTPPQNGDLNGDDRITPADAAIVLAFAVGGGSASCDPAMLSAADVSGDNRVTSLDALMILQAAAGAIDIS